jgi:hypothetical protein
MGKHSHLPKYNEFLNPLFQALHDQIAVNKGPDRFSTIFIHYTTPNAFTKNRRTQATTVGDVFLLCPGFPQHGEVSLRPARLEV